MLSLAQERLSRSVLTCFFILTRVFELRFFTCFRLFPTFVELFVPPEIPSGLASSAECGNGYLLHFRLLFDHDSRFGNPFFYLFYFVSFCLYRGWCDISILDLLRFDLIFCVLSCTGRLVFTGKGSCAIPHSV